jgi:hypothetical protein
MVAKGVKMHYFQDVVHKKLIKQMGAEFHNYGTRMGEIRWYPRREVGLPCQLPKRNSDAGVGTKYEPSRRYAAPCRLGALAGTGTKDKQLAPHVEFRLRGAQYGQSMRYTTPCGCRLGAHRGVQGGNGDDRERRPEDP